MFGIKKQIQRFQSANSQRREKRREFRLQKQKNRIDGRNYRTDSRGNTRIEQTQARQEGKTSRNDRTQSANEIAYQNGVQPAETGWQTLTHEASGLVGNLLGGSRATMETDLGNVDFGVQTSSNSKTPLLLAAGIAALVWFLSKK